MSDTGANALAKCYASDKNLTRFALLACLTMASYVAGMIWMLVAKKTKGDEEYWETIGEVIERGFWMIAFFFMAIFGVNSVVQVLVLLAVAASLPRGVYAVYTMAK